MIHIFVLAGGILLVLGLYALSGVIIMWAWNMLLHGIFNLPIINFWQGLAASLILSAVGGFFKAKS